MRKEGILHIVLMFFLLGTGLANARPITEEITLYPGTKKNAYTLFFPLQIKEPGQIAISGGISQAKPPITKNKQPLFLTLVDASLFWEDLSEQDWQRWLNKQYTPPMKQQGRRVSKERRHTTTYGLRVGRISHNVDATELGRFQGRYVLLVGNRGKHEVQQKIVISLPNQNNNATSTQARQPRQKCDLMVKTISRNRNGQAVVTIVNLGPGGVPKRAYEGKGKNAVTLMLSRNGKSWGGSTLAKFDPQQRLMKPGARVRYTSNLTITDHTEIKATVDASSKIRERNEKNNSLTQKF